MFLSRTLLALFFSVATFVIPAAAAPTYVGSYQVDDGPFWTVNPTVYSAREAAALIFGGLPTDYFVSINPSLDSSTITFTGWYTTWGISGGQEYQQDFKKLTGTGYNDPGGVDSAISAYTRDNAIGSAYTNYVWSINGAASVPEPSTYGLLGSGLVGMLFVIRRRRA